MPVLNSKNNIMDNAGTFNDSIIINYDHKKLLSKIRMNNNSCT